MLENGEYGTLAPLSAAERISRSYICRVLRLTLLAPDIVERVMDGGPAAGLARLLGPFPVEWEMQREQFLARYLPVCSIAASEVESLVLGEVRRLLASPELVARTITAVPRESGDVGT